MKKRFLLPIVLCCASLFCSTDSNAQIVGSDVFLQGQYLEIGMLTNGALGTTTSPVTYHSHTFGASVTTGSSLSMVYDAGHDGWTVGTPIFNGDYTYEGFPLEGWELQVGAGRSQAFCPTPTFATGGVGSTLTGAVTGYTNSGGSAVATWTGTEASGQLAITMNTRVDTNASWVIMTVKMYNLGATDLNGVYYMRHCDPDNDMAWSSTVNTNNVVTYQNDAFSRVLVSATGPVSGAYMGLGTTDNRAVAFYSSTWPVPVTTDLATVYDGTASLGATYTVGTMASADQAMGLVFKLGTIKAGDSLTLAYTYVFNDATGIDSVNDALCGGPLVAGTVVPNTTTGCPGSTVNFSLSGASAYSVTAYQWQSSPDNTTWTDIAGATANAYSASGLVADTWFRCRVLCTVSGASVFTPGQLISFTPLCPCPSLSAGAVMPNVTTACATTPITLDDAGYTITGATYQWQSSSDGSSWADISGATTVPYSFTGITADTHYRLVVTCIAGGSVTSAGQLITFDPSCSTTSCSASAGIVYSSVSIACPTTIINLTDAGYTATGTATQWQASLDSASWSDIAATLVPYSFSGIVATTFYRLKVTCISTGTSVFSPGRKIIFTPSCGGGTTAVNRQATGRDVSLYPNPVKDQLIIKADPATYQSYIISNSIGQQVLTGTVTAHDTQADVKQLPTGVYYIALRGNEGNAAQKFVKW